MLALLPLSAISALTWSARTVSVPCRPALLRMEATDTAAVATLVVAATVSAAEEYAVKAGAGSAGDLFGGEGIEPVLQMACRDRNRIAIQADLLGAHALGIRNLLCLTGDPVRAGAVHQHRDGAALQLRESEG